MAREMLNSLARYSMKLRLALGLLLAFGAVNAFGGGLYGMLGARDVPTAWLEGTPFSDYRIPSLILFVVVGGSFLFAAVLVLGRAPIARVAAFAAVAIVAAWLITQVALIGYVSWMQPVTAVAAVVMLLLASRLRYPGAVDRA